MRGVTAVYSSWYIHTYSYNILIVTAKKLFASFSQLYDTANKEAERQNDSGEGRYERAADHDASSDVTNGTG